MQTNPNNIPWNQPSIRSLQLLQVLEKIPASTRRCNVSQARFSGTKGANGEPYRSLSLDTLPPSQAEPSPILPFLKQRCRTLPYLQSPKSSGHMTSPSHPPFPRKMRDHEVVRFTRTKRRARHLHQSSAQAIVASIAAAPHQTI